MPFPRTVFPPSTVAHPWRSAWATMAIAFCWTLVLYFAFVGIGWLAIHIGSWGWSFVPVTA